MYKKVQEMIHECKDFNEFKFWFLVLNSTLISTEEHYKNKEIEEELKIKIDEL